MGVRLACPEDKDALLALWRACFDDGGSFQYWFFHERFLPAYCMVEQRDGQIVGAMHGIPLEITVRGSILPCIVIGGVATMPAYQGQGVMRAVFSAYMREMRARGFVWIAHRPQHLPTFFRFGHYPSSEAQFLTLPADCARPMAGAYEVCPADAAPQRLYPCYAAFAARYSGILARSYPDMAFKCADYASDGMRCALVCGEDGQPDGYCIYEDGEDVVYGEETVALTENAYGRLFAAMAQEAGNRTLTLKLPGDAHVPTAQAARETKPWNVLGLIDAGRMISAALGGRGMRASLEVLDDTVPGNAGVYGADGMRTDEPPQIRLAAGRLAQWLVGYRSLAELAAEGNAEIIDQDAARALDAALPKQPCWIVDEY